jgi:uncharacterized cupredoxin-like copper-binding protein
MMSARPDGSARRTGSHLSQYGRTVSMWKTATDRIVPVSRPLARVLVLGAVAGAFALLTAACGSSGSSTAAPPAAPATSQAAGSSSGGAAAGTQVTASLTEFHIGLSQQTFSAGTYTFAVSNDGHATHALEITGPGLSNAETTDLSPGQKANLKVTLQSGSYDFFCPVGNHKALGMNMDVSVTVSSGAPAGGSSGATTAAVAAGGGGGNGY